MDSILLQIQQKANFDAFIAENMRLSSYTPLWVQECGPAEYSASKNFSTYTATYAAAVMASMIEKNAQKPIRNMPTVGQITGTIGRMGDKFQLDNDRLDQLMQLEGRYRDRQTNFSAEQKKSEFQRIVQFLFNPYENASIAPHKRLDSLYYEGLTNGTYTVDLTNNPDGITWSVDLGIKKYVLEGAIWNDANAATSNPILDIKNKVKDMEGNGRIVTKLRMTQNTFDKMVTSQKFTAAFKLNFGSLEVSTSAIIPVEKVNQYFSGVGLPTIVIEKALAKLPSGATVNMFKDDRIVLQCTDRVAKVIVSDPLELRLPHPNKVYTSYLDNLISNYVTEEGRFVEYEMWALPVFDNKDDFAILQTDQTD